MDGSVGWRSQRSTVVGRISLNTAKTARNGSIIHVWMNWTVCVLNKSIREVFFFLSWMPEAWFIQRKCSKVAVFNISDCVKQRLELRWIPRRCAQVSCGPWAIWSVKCTVRKKKKKSEVQREVNTTGVRRISRSCKNIPTSWLFGAMMDSVCSVLTSRRRGIVQVS